MIDAGTGAGRLVERPELLAGINRLDILLTHFHLDHIAGLAYLPAIGVRTQTIVWGPGRLLYETPTSQILERLSHEPFHPVALEDQEIEVRDLPAGEVELAGVHVRLRRQDHHSAPTLGLRFDDLLTWITDTAYDEGSARFAAGYRALAHEAWFPSAQPRNPDIHSSARQAGQVAREAAVQRLLLIHLPPFRPGLDELTLEAEQSGAAHTVAADDGLDVSALLS
jgi:ribonuclease BN (tRNA processing enzyme)